MLRLKFFFLCILFYSCSTFEHNPNDIELEDHERNLTEKNLALIAAQQPGDTIRMIFTGDTQRFYDDTKDLVKTVNSRPRADFVIISGDISDFGLPAEFRWMNELYSELNVPYLTVIGNHDVLGNGRYVYQEMFGEYDYSFTYGRFHFVMVNTNSREFAFNGNVPDLSFLQKELVDTHTGLSKILCSHVRPGMEDFDPALEEPLKVILQNTDRFIGGFHGHSHDYQVNYPLGPEFPFVSSSSPSHRMYIEVTFYANNNNVDTFQIEKIFY